MNFFSRFRKRYNWKPRLVAMSFRSACLLAILAIPMAFAAGTDLAFMVPAVAVIVAISLSLASMLSGMIQDAQLEAWAKTEFRELVAGLVLVAIIIALF